ncbi:hypothetical protein [Arthrobacter tumbae]|uniref:hypothetical protein n=1 Tax=Arthrobacter tumbae TaxID=163874 RepID=UPI00195EA7C6|nr:hypothetical protein [Arthrobacter tumbae]MBM7779892.1 hypothetical protein [Arthrobacter tumbae]
MGTQQLEETVRTKTSRVLRWDCVPAVIVLIAVAGFWIGGSLEWFEMLSVPENAVGSVVWLYLMLAAVAGSVVLGGGAVVDLARRINRRSERNQ